MRGSQQRSARAAPPARIAALALALLFAGRRDVSSLPTFAAKRSVGLSTNLPQTPVAGRGSGARLGLVYGGPKYLKVLIAIDALDSLGGSSGLQECFRDTPVNWKLSGRGEFYPFRDKGVPRRKVLIMGGRKSALVLGAKKLWTTIGSSMEAAGRRPPPVMKFLVPRTAKSQLIGKGGRNIQQAQIRTGSVLTLGDVDLSNENMVIVSGEPSAIGGAVGWLIDEQEEHESEMRGILNTEYQSSLLSFLPGDIRVHIDERTAAWLSGSASEDVDQIARDFGVVMTVVEIEEGGQHFLTIKGIIGNVHACHSFMREYFLIHPDEARDLRNNWRGYWNVPEEKRNRGRRS